MLVLSLPEMDDAATLKTLGLDPRFSAHMALWAQAYADYVAAGGDSWVLTPTMFADDIADDQRGLYDARRKTNPFRAIRRRRDFGCCPMCGSDSRGHLDHFLPRVAYPEFSVFGPNLVPACPSCNSSNKGKIYQGVAPERFLHPYFDTLAADAIWFVEIHGDLDAPEFSPRAMPGLEADDASRVAFHLAHVLGWDFYDWVARNFADLPQRVRDARESAITISAHDTQSELKILARQAVGSQGRNSWPAALLRGVLQNPDAPAHIAAKAEQLIPTRI